MRGKKGLSVLLSFSMVAGACLPGFGVSAADGADEDRLVYYNFQDYSSTIIEDASGNGKAAVMENYDAGGFRIVDANIYGKEVKALSLPGGADGGYLEMPVGILDGQDAITINTWVKLPTDTGYQRIWDFGSDTTSYMYLLSDGGNEGFVGYSAAITRGGWTSEVGVSKGSNFDKNRWVLTTVVMDGTEMTLYENGEKIGTKDTGISVSDLGETTGNYIGYGQFGDNPTQGQFAEFEIFNYAMTDEQVADLYYVDDAAIVAGDLAELDLGDLSAVTQDITLPTEGVNGSAIAWASSDENVIATDGKVTRPEAGADNAVVTLTATASYGEATATRTFEATVLAQEEEITIVGYEPIEVTTQMGTIPSLPNFVEVNYSDGSMKKERTVWTTPTEDQYGQTGSFEAKGTVRGTTYPIKASVTVVEQLDSEAVLEADDFDLNDISLDGDSILTQNRDRTLTYLKLLDNDRMLYNFRKTFGQDTLGAQPLGGWDAPTGLLRGHSTGHYLSALALAYASTKDQEIKDKLDYMVHELRELQKLSKGDPAAFETKGTDQEKDWSKDPNTWGEGFLSAYSPDQFALLEVYTPYATIWAPYYTLHKIIAGFLDAYTYTGNEEALEAAEGIGQWVYKRLSACTQEQLTKMWDMYIAGEFGGFNQCLAKLYEITGNMDYLNAAKLFDNTKFFDKLDKNIDDIQGRHANQHIPQIVGALEMYNATVQAGEPEQYYYNVAKNFWDLVVSRYAYSIGGVGTGERFQTPYDLAANIATDTNCETCAAYNMLKLTNMLYQYDADNAEYMDYYERTLYNQIIASQNPNVTANMHNGTTYMLPIGPGVRKSYGGDYNSFTCCHGTGMENHVKYQEAAYHKTDDTLYVNLYMPSTVTWEEKGVAVVQENQFPSENTKLTVNALEGASASAFDMKLRVPYWAENGFTVTVNGDTVIENPEVTTYVALEDIKVGDVIEIYMPFGYHLDETPDQLNGTNVASIMYGPFVMVAQLDSTDWKTLVLPQDLSQSIKKVEGQDVPTLTTNGLTFRPMYDAADYAYHTYFKIVEGDGTSAYYEINSSNATPDRGHLELSTEMIKEGDDLIITAVPEEGYKLKRLTINGTSVKVDESGSYVVEDVRENIEITCFFAQINPPVPENDALEQTAMVSAHFTASWENLEGIKNQNFRPTISNAGTGKGWGNWSQPSGSWAWVEYEWDAPVTINGTSIFWYDDGGGTQVPAEFGFQYEDENGVMQEVTAVSDLNEAKKLDQYNDMQFETFTTSRLRINMKISNSANAVGIYRWIVSFTEEDMVDLGSWIDFMEDLNAEEYTAESWSALQEAIDAAKAVQADENATRAEIDKAVANLVTAFGGLEYGVQKTHLQVAVDAAEAILNAAGDYQEDSLAALKAVIDDAKAILADAEATQDEVNNMTADLIDAIVQVAKEADLVSLESLLAAVEGLDEGKYTSESWASLRAAVETAKAVLADTQREDGELADAYTGLAEAIRGLVMRGNKAALEAVIEKAEEILSNASQYVASSISGLDAALEAAQVVYDNADAVLAEVSAATEALTKEIVKARLLGDGDRDGKIATSDSATLLRYNAEMDSLDAEQLEGADVNGDGKADTKDAALILQYASEKISAF